jgi:hypothetical protein
MERTSCFANRAVKLPLQKVCECGICTLFRILTAVLVPGGCTVGGSKDRYASNPMKGQVTNMLD